MYYSNFKVEWFMFSIYHTVHWQFLSFSFPFVLFCLWGLKTKIRLSSMQKYPNIPQCQIVRLSQNTLLSFIQYQRTIHHCKGCLSIHTLFYSVLQFFIPLFLLNKCCKVEILFVFLAFIVPIPIIKAVLCWECSKFVYCQCYSLRHSLII